MSNSLNILLVGASGRMGREIAAIATGDSSSATIVGGIADDVVQFGFPVSTDWSEEFEQASVLIDFSSAEGTEKSLRIALERKIPVVIGTTGLASNFEQRLDELAQSVPVLYASNFSVGVNVATWLASRAAQMLGEQFDAEIVELHHKMKKDAPSGTALTLGRAVAEAKGLDAGQSLSFGRSGICDERKPQEIGIQAVRGGDVPGEHTVFYFGSGERIEITHRASERSIFAKGALRAASWLLGQSPGRYSMFDVLGVDE